MGTAKVDDARFTQGILNMADAARFLALSQPTFHRWAKGYERGEPLIHVIHGVPTRKANVSFIALTEAYVLAALRDAGVQLRRVRPALDKLQKEFGREYVLTAPNLATDGIDVLWDFSKSREGAGLIEARTGRYVIREIVEDYLQYISWDSSEIPYQLVLRQWQPAKIVVDLRHSFGQPRFGVSGPRVADVAAMLKAGEPGEVVADEFGISRDEVRTAARVLLGRAA
ncbi:hypothetical protein [Mycolicibacterium thermoresistibile]|uniref:Putative antitoxin VapB45-like DNA-binding HTH domain-containing protein n=2 Tax=Mycolicibacterium thermoresistibile TaxID=1797 RepID=G7CF43_MYCT3|nr:hypothetical protein [Mycolicibacterium thermoresistibile]EHI13122.1 hypothetical protein KEK_08072 [Mycolicibacterium thermoresistibile ATCC 19527]MCV7187065.1 hypothetical protein [Mycolicibacterium thermoresistibile]SNW20310.1 Uncharacterized conserved protein [Mycolicibacterium thermoresistibile]